MDTAPPTVRGNAVGQGTVDACVGDLCERLAAIHAEIRTDPVLRGVDRIAVGVHDPATDAVSMFAHSTDGPAPILHHSARLSSVPGLRRIAETGRPKADNDLRPSRRGGEVSRVMALHGYRSRYVVPVVRQGGLFGFVFFNSRTPGCFTAAVLDRLRPWRLLVAEVAVNDLVSLRSMLAAVRTARAVGKHRDEETGAHLDRMSHFSALVARHMAPATGMSDGHVEYLLQYAPLHDIGKVAVPDAILLKPGKLTDAEFEVMKTHVAKGLDIVDAMVRDPALRGLPHQEVLRNVVGCHHEAWDGSGYPRGLAGLDIPLDGRIVAVADVFDALTSERPYKRAWSNREAAEFLRAHAGRRFDADCVDALLARMDEVEEIQARFRDERRDASPHQ